MEQLPYIDEHAIAVDASRAVTWKALLRFGTSDGLETGQAMRGFVVGTAQAPEKLVLRGRHWFSRYELVFLLAEDGTARTVLRAQTWATFPGLHGKAYRAMVIGSGGHRLMVRHMLKRIASMAVDDGSKVRS